MMICCTPCIFCCILTAWRNLWLNLSGVYSHTCSQLQIIIRLCISWWHHWFPRRYSQEGRARVDSNAILPTTSNEGGVSIMYAWCINALLYYCAATVLPMIGHAVFLFVCGWPSYDKITERFKRVKIYRAKCCPITQIIEDLNSSHPDTYF